MTIPAFKQALSFPNSRGINSLNSALLGASHPRRKSLMGVPCTYPKTGLIIFPAKPALIPLPSLLVNGISDTPSHLGWLTGTPSSLPLIAYPHSWTVLSLSLPKPISPSPGPQPQFRPLPHPPPRPPGFPYGLSLLWFQVFLHPEFIPCSVLPGFPVLLGQYVSPSIFISAQALTPFPELPTPLSLGNSYSSFNTQLKYPLCLGLRRRLSVLGMQG